MKIKPLLSRIAIDKQLIEILEVIEGNILQTRQFYPAEEHLHKSPGAYLFLTKGSFLVLRDDFLYVDRTAKAYFQRSKTGAYDAREEYLEAETKALYGSETALGRRIAEALQKHLPHDGITAHTGGNSPQSSTTGVLVAVEKPRIISFTFSNDEAVEFLKNRTA